jgi:hypothetical protein
VPLACEIIAFDITWLMSFLNRRSLPDNFFNFLFADLVATCCNVDLNLEYLCLVFSTSPHYLVQDEFHHEMGVIINDVDSDQTNYHIVNGQTNSLA